MYHNPHATTINERATALAHGCGHTAAYKDQRRRDGLPDRGQRGGGSRSRFGQGAQGLHSLLEKAAVEGTEGLGPAFELDDEPEVLQLATLQVT